MLRTLHNDRFGRLMKADHVMSGMMGLFCYWRDSIAQSIQRILDSRQVYEQYCVAASEDAAASEDPDPDSSSSYSAYAPTRVFVSPAALDPASCAAALSSAIAHLSSTATPWTTSRHYAVPTTDAPVCSIPPLLTWFNAALQDSIYPLLATQFSLHPAARLRVLDAFLVK